MMRWTVRLKGGQKRNYHAAVAVGHKLYSIRWYGQTYMYDMGHIDVHIFNTMSLRWIKLPPGREQRPKDVTSMHYGHTAVLIEDIIYIWGGALLTRVGGVAEPTYSNVLYAFDVDTHRWFKPKISGTVPEARCGHSACVLGKTMYIFGGFKLNSGYTNSIHTLDTTTMVWSLITTRGIPAPASSCHSAIIIGTKMFVFGGQVEQFEGHECNNSNNRIRVFDTVTNFWLSMPSTELLPDGRACHSAFAYNGELYIFGGLNFRLNFTFNDTWKFNLETFSWKKIEPKGFPLSPSSVLSRLCCCMVGDRIILFEGYRYKPIQGECEDQDEDDASVSDLNILDLSPSLKTLCKLAIIQYGLEQSGLPRDIRWELEAMTTNSNRKGNGQQFQANGTEQRERLGDCHP